MTCVSINKFICWCFLVVCETKILLVCSMKKCLSVVCSKYRHVYFSTDKSKLLSYLSSVSLVANGKRVYLRSEVILFHYLSRIKILRSCVCSQISSYVYRKSVIIMCMYVINIYIYIAWNTMVH